MTTLKQTFSVPVVDSWVASLSADTTARRYVEVPARNSGVPGLIVTAQTNRYTGHKEGWWVLTHKATGRSLGSAVFKSIAAARRAAKAVAFVDWTFESVEDFLAIPESKRARVGRQLRELSQ